jgi:hypothetical protein
MNDINERSELEEVPFSDSVELFDNIFSEEVPRDTSESVEKQPSSASDSSGDVTGENNKKILESDVKDIAVKFWKYLNKDSKDTFLDADIKDASRTVLEFLNRDVVGKKIVLLEDDKLKTVNIVTRALKRKRKVIKTDREKATIKEIQKIYTYLNNPFWQSGMLIRKARNYLDKNLRTMTPTVVRNLTDDIKKLRPYFNGVTLNDNILETDRELRNMSRRFGCRQFAICEKHQQPLAKNRTGDVLCPHTDCGSRGCPFDACKAHGEEVAFLSDLKELLVNTGVMKDNGIIWEDL